MKTCKKTVYVSDDGLEFDTEQGCIDHENECSFNKVLHDSNDEFWVDDFGAYAITDYSRFKCFVTRNGPLVRRMLELVEKV
jgi:hypothetical protein